MINKSWRKRDVEVCHTFCLIRNYISIIQVWHTFSGIRTIMYGLTMALMIFIFSACKKKDNVRSTSALMMVINASPNAGKIDLLQNLKLIGNGQFDYVKGLNLPPVFYYTVDSGFNNYKIRKGADEFANALLSNTSNNVSFWIYDSLSTSTVKYLLLADNLDTPGRARAKVRYLFLSPDMDTVNVTRNGTDTIYLNASYYKTQQQVNNGSLASFVLADTGNALIKFVPKNTTTALRIYRHRFDGNAVYTFIIKGYRNRAGADSLSLSVIKHN